MSVRAASLAVALCMLASSVPARATSLRALTLSELVAESTLVVHAHVVSVTDRVHRSQGRLAPRTTTRLRVLESLVGHAREIVLEASVGATGPSARRDILGSPHFARGDEVVLFLRMGATGLAPVGMGQGVFRVIHAGIAAPVCVRNLEDVEVVGDTAIPERVPLTDLRAAILALGAPR